MPNDQNKPNDQDIAMSRDFGNPQNGRPSVLDEEKKRLICTLIAAGTSRRQAARYVGCSPSTVSRHLNTDEEFAEQLRAAEMQNEFAPLGHLRKAAGRSWRAAAWLLERQHPNQYARRNPDLITRDEFRDTMSMLAGLLDEEIHDPEDRSRVRHRLASLIGRKAPEGTRDES